MNPWSLSSLSYHLERLSKNSDPPDAPAAMIDFEYFLAWLVEVLGYGDGWQGAGRHSIPIRCSGA